MSVDIPNLEHKEEFRELLRNYQIGNLGKALLASMDFVVLSGVAGGGRNTVINHLVEHANYYFIISDTTRPPKVRDGKLEQDGVQYHFRKEDEVLTDIKTSKFLEAELIHEQQVSGISLRELQHAHDLHKVAIAEIEYKGVNNIAAASPKTHIIGLLPPSFETWLERWNNREQMTSQERTNRLHTAQSVFENMLEKPYFKFVVNDTIPHAAQGVQDIVSGNYSTEMAELGRNLAVDILEKVRGELAL